MQSLLPANYTAVAVKINNNCITTNVSVVSSCCVRVTSPWGKVQRCCRIKITDPASLLVKYYCSGIIASRVLCSVFNRWGFSLKSQSCFSFSLTHSLPLSLTLLVQFSALTTPQGSLACLFQRLRFKKKKEKKATHKLNWHSSEWGTHGSLQFRKKPSVVFHSKLLICSREECRVVLLRIHGTKYSLICACCFLTDAPYCWL
jgi:hypothetical protein